VIQPHSRKRIGDNKVDRTVEDILSIVAIVDENDCRHLLPTFCASSLSRIPVMPDDMSELAAIRSELSDLRRQFNNLMTTVETVVKCKAQPPLSVQAPTQPTHGSGSTSHDEVSTDINDDAGRSDDVCDDDPLTAHPDFAGMVKLNRDKYVNSDGFTTTSRTKHANRKKVTVGDSASISTINGVAKKAFVCVNRLDLGTTVDDVESHLRANNVSVISCFALDNSMTNSRPRSFTAMRLCVPHVHLRKVYDAGIWPVGVVVRLWIFKTNAAVDGSSTSNLTSCYMVFLLTYLH